MSTFNRNHLCACGTLMGKRRNALRSSCPSQPLACTRLFKITLPAMHFRSSHPLIQDPERSNWSTTHTLVQNETVCRACSLHEEIKSNLPADGRVGEKIVASPATDSK